MTGVEVSDKYKLKKEILQKKHFINFVLAPEMVDKIEKEEGYSEMLINEIL